MDQSVEKNLKQQEFYNTLNPEYLDFSKNTYYARHLVKRLMTVMSNNKNAHVLEVGAGQGRFSFELVRHIGRLTATDLSKKQIDILKKSQITIKENSIECYVQDLLKPIRKDLENRKYDAIVGFFLLHHIHRTSYQKVIHNLLPLIKKGGRMVFTEPNCLYPLHLVEMLIVKDMHWEIEKQIYTNYLGTFVSIAQNAGMKLVRFERFGFFPPLFINKLPQLIRLEKILERLPIFNQFLSPFVLLAFEKK